MRTMLLAALLIGALSTAQASEPSAAVAQDNANKHVVSLDIQRAGAENTQETVLKTDIAAEKSPGFETAVFSVARGAAYIKSRSTDIRGRTLLTPGMDWSVIEGGLDVSDGAKLTLNFGRISDDAFKARRTVGSRLDDKASEKTLVLQPGDNAIDLIVNGVSYTVNALYTPPAATSP